MSAVQSFVHVNWSKVVYGWRCTKKCPTCKRVRRFIAEDFGWYGVDWTCLTCGDCWGSEGRYPKVFKSERETTIAKAKAKWATYGAHNNTEHEMRMNEWVGVKV